MKTKLILIGGGAAVAAYLVFTRSKGFLEAGGEEFREGYLAGFLTPGPFTILAVAGIVAWNI